MKYQCVETTDMYKTAALICNGGELAGLKQQKRRRTYSFLIKGRGLHQLDLDYRNGLALVNALKFRETLNHLRDLLFTKKHEGRYDDDRKTRDRAHQKKR